jgi:hypothetical protein
MEKKRDVMTFEAFRSSQKTPADAATDLEDLLLGWLETQLSKVNTPLTYKDMHLESVSDFLTLEPKSLKVSVSLIEINKISTRKEILDKMRELAERVIADSQLTYTLEGGPVVRVKFFWGKGELVGKHTGVL